MSSENIALACQRAWEALDLSNCKPLGLDAATWIAVLTAFVAASVFVVRWVRRRKRSANLDNRKVSRSLWRSRFRNLCRSIKPIMDENYRIFSRFGPNSGRGDGLPKMVRSDLGIWYQMRETIVENNAQIRALITNNLSEIPVDYRPIFHRWLDHIDAFRAHVLDNEADYREHQFPRGASDIVNRHA